MIIGMLCLAALMVSSACIAGSAIKLGLGDEESSLLAESRALRSANNGVPYTPFAATK